MIARRLKPRNEYVRSGLEREKREEKIERKEEKKKRRKEKIERKRETKQKDEI